MNFGKRNNLHEFLCKLGSRLEDLLFLIIQKLPERMIPSALMNWVDRYIDKRMHELKQQLIRDKWNKIELEKTVSKISNMQQDKKKTPPED